MPHASMDGELVPTRSAAKDSFSDLALICGLGNENQDSLATAGRATKSVLGEVRLHEPVAAVPYLGYAGFVDCRDDVR